MIQTLAANRANHTLDVGALPRRPWSRQYLLDSHRFHLIDEVLPEDSIPIAQEIPWRAVPRKRLPELVRGPFRGRMGCHAEVENASTVVCQDQEDVEDLETDRGHGKKVDGHQTVNVVLPLSSPAV